jgi:iron complex transport system substrate-binding protein
MTGTRIVSLLPAATEMACALGLADRLVGISHECRYPDFIAARPKLTRSVLPQGLNQAAIDAFVTARLRAGESLYEVDEALLRALEPDLILTQDLCEVCGVSSREVDRACEILPNNPHLLRFSPKSLAGIYENLKMLGEATGRSEAAARIVADARRRTLDVESRVASLPKPRVFCMEWLDPPYCSGHWVPEMVESAGGVDRLSRKGTDSVRVEWADVLAWSPEVLLLMPCGFDLQEIIPQTARMPSLPGWAQLPAVRDDRVFVVDANAYFARPGPRVVDGIELLARLIHPELEWRSIEAAAVRLRTKICESCRALFLCQQSAGCWCGTVCVPHAELKKLSETHSDCLCPDCLGSYAGRQAEVAAAT